MASKYIPPCLRPRRNKAPKDISLVFRNELVAAIDKGKGKLEMTSKALDIIVGKPEYKQLAMQLLDIIYTGGLLSEEGKLAVQGELKLRSNYCVFKAREDLAALRVYEQLIGQLMRRYKHVSTALEPHARRLLQLLPNFEPGARRRLARMIALLLMSGALTYRILPAVGQQALIEEGLALDFVLELFTQLKREKGVPFLLRTIKSAGLESKILSFMPPQLRSDLYFQQVYQENDLMEIVKLYQLRAGIVVRRQLRQLLLDDIDEEVPFVEMVKQVRQFQYENNMSDSEIIGIVWHTIMSLREWNSRECFAPEQATRHVEPYCPLLNALCRSDSAQIALLLRVQEYCYENHSFLQCFERLVVHLYNKGVVNEDAIVRWYEVDHIDSGKVAFIGQMQRFIQWLKTGSDASCRPDYNIYVADRRKVMKQPKVYSDMITITSK